MNAPQDTPKNIPTLDLAIEAHEYAFDHAPRVLAYLDAPVESKPDERRRWIELALARAYTTGALQGIEVGFTARAKVEAAVEAASE